MTVLPSDRIVDLEELRTAFGTRHLRLAKETELQDLFPECELGAMPSGVSNGNTQSMTVTINGQPT